MTFNSKYEIENYFPKRKNKKKTSKSFLSLKKKETVGGNGWERVGTGRRGCRLAAPSVNSRQLEPDGCKNVAIR